MRFAFWVTALAVLSIACAKNSTAKSKPKRQLESIRTPQNLQYSLVLPHSRVHHFRSLTSERRISNVAPKSGKLPPYAVQMEPVVQYSQKDPLYDPTLDNIEDAVVNKNELYAQPKILNVQDQVSEHTYEPLYGTLPTAPLYSHNPHHGHGPQYYEAPEPIIEIIIKESNETLPAPPPPPPQKKKKEPVHVFYVKYSKDPHNKDKVVYEKPVPAITPPTNDEEDHHEHHGHEDYVTVTPEPYYAPQKTTTLRAIIKPESEVYHSDSSVRVTFGNEGNHHHHSDRREGNLHNEDHEETAPRPAIAYPQERPNHPPLERSVSSQPHQQEQPASHQHSQPQPRPQSHGQPHLQLRAQYHESSRPISHSAPQNYRQPPQQHAQSRVQFQSPYLANEQQLPRQGPSSAPFRGQPHIARQNPFGPSPSQVPPFNNGPGPAPHFGNVAPTIPGPIGPTFSRPTNQPSFHPRPSNPPPFGPGPRPHFNGPPRPAFHSGPQRPFHPPQQQSPTFFDDPKYLQENYHTITTEQVEPPKDQPPPNRPNTNFKLVPRPSPSPQYQEHPGQFSGNQQLPQQRPHQHFTDSKPSFSSGPSRPPGFFNLKPSPPQIDDNRHVFQQQQPPSHQQFSFHQGPQHLSRPIQVADHNQFVGPSPSPIPQNQFLPQPSAQPEFNFRPQPSSAPHQQFQFQSSERPQFNQGPHSPSERPQFQQNHGPSERPQFQEQSNFHRQNVEQFVPNGGELIHSIPKYEQHITVSGPTAQPNYSGLSEPTPTASHQEQQYQHHQQHQQQPSHHQPAQIHQEQSQPPPQYIDQEQEQVRLQLALNVKKQQEEIQRLQAQLLQAQQQQQQQEHQQQQQQQQHQHQQQQVYKHSSKFSATSSRPQYSQERSKPQQNYVSSTSSPPYYQSTSRTVEIRPTTQKYASSTVNSIVSKPETKKEEKKKKPTFELPDEVPDDLRQQLLSSGILDNADISILDYDKVGDTPLDSLPPDQLANFFSAGGGQQIAASETQPIVVKPDGERIQSRIDQEEEDDQEPAASENVPSYAIVPAPTKQAVEMKVVHFDPKTAEGQNIAKGYVKDDATQVEPVALNDKKYNRYLPLKVSGNQFPLPDILKGRKITSVVVLAPVETEALNGDHSRSERATSTSLKGIKFIAGDSLQDVLKRPTKDNFEKWLETEKKTDTDLQSVVLLVTGDDEVNREIYMYDISSGNVNKLNGDLSNAFVEAAENNSLSKDIEKLAIEGDGLVEDFNKDPVDEDSEASENVPLFVDLSGVNLEQESNSQVSISSGYSKTKLGRSLRRN